MDIEGDVWADGEQDALAEIAALSGTRRRARAPCLCAPLLRRARLTRACPPPRLRS
jgi:hypothetical protein